MDTENREGEAAPAPDVFGIERPPEDAPVEPAAKEEEGKEKKEPVDVENSPVVKELRAQLKQLEDDKSSMGGNLSAQGKAIDALKKELASIKDGNKPSAEPVFKDIKRVKDYSQEEQDEMTDAQKALVEQLADTQEAMNKQVADAATKEAEAAARAEAEGEEAVAAEAFNQTVQAEALRISGNDKDVANAIIAEFNQFAENDKLNEKQLKERIEKAAKLVPDYKPQKEQKSPTGSVPKPAEAGANPEIDKIVEETVRGTKPGSTYKL